MRMKAWRGEQSERLAKNVHAMNAKRSESGRRDTHMYFVNE